MSLLKKKVIYNILWCTCCGNSKCYTSLL